MALLHTGFRLLLAVAALTLSGAQEPRTDRGLAVTRPAQESRVALVIGNGAYRSAPLRNPASDATAMAERLRTCGFRVTLLVDASRERMFTALRDFGNVLQGGGVGLFYFAGHGVQVKGRNYLVPTDADLASEDEVPYTALDTESVLAKLETAHNRLNIVILDACRNNPFGRSVRSAQQGLAQMEAPAGTFLAYATAPGRTAADGAGDHGLYTEHLLSQLAVPGLRVEDVFKRVRAGVMEGSEGQQVPWESSSLTGDFFFLASDDAPPAAVEPHRLPPPAPRIARATVTRRDGRFTAYDDRTVVDSTTELMWAARDNGIDITWAQASTFCTQYRAGGYTDWRLPTGDELAGLYDATRTHPAACNKDATVGVGTELIDITCFWVWSAETRKAFFNNNFSAFSFGRGAKGWLVGTEAHLCRVLPVRSMVH